MNESAVEKIINSPEGNWAEYRPVNKVSTITKVISQPI
jgi:hypothetical protein